MKLLLKRKLIPWSWHYYIEDERGNRLYLIDTKMENTGREMFIHCATNLNKGEHVAFIKEQYELFIPKYTIEINGQKVCEMMQDWKFFNRDFFFEGVPYHLEGSFLLHNYSLHRGDKPIMDFSKRLFALIRECYHLHIFDPKDQLLCICIAAIVCWTDGRAAGIGKPSDA